MYANTIKSIIIGLILLISCNDAIAQDVDQGRQPSSWQIGGFGGFSQYYGDVSNKSFFQKFSGETKVSFGFLVRHHFNENFGLGVNYSRSNIFSTKDVLSTGAPLNMQYSGWLSQVSAHSYLNFSNFFWGYADRKVNWFGTLGVGYAWWEGTLSNSLTGAIITDYTSAKTQNYESAGAAIPASLGLEFALTSNLKLTVETTLLTLISDDFDYYRDGYQYDILSLTHFGLSYFIGKSDNQKTARVESSTAWEPESPISVINYEVFKELPEEKVQVQVPPLTITPVVKEEKVVNPIQQVFEFRVQIYAKSEKSNHPSGIYKNLNFEYPIVENIHNGLYRYSTGSFQSYSDAEAYAHKLQSRGIYDAFVVAYRNNERVPITAEMKR